MEGLPDDHADQSPLHQVPPALLVEGRREGPVQRIAAAVAIRAGVGMQLPREQQLVGPPLETPDEFVERDPLFGGHIGQFGQHPLPRVDDLPRRTAPTAR